MSVMPHAWQIAASRASDSTAGNYQPTGPSNRGTPSPYACHKPFENIGLEIEKPHGIRHFEVPARHFEVPYPAL